MVNSKQKGSAGERELAEALRKLGFTGARRAQQYCGVAGDADIVDAIPGVFIEAKRVEHLQLYNAMAQAIMDSMGTGDIPAVFHRRNHEEWLVTVRLDRLIRFCQRVFEAAFPPKVTP
jgi:Holliday junction resolvase